MSRLTSAWDDAAPSYDRKSAWLERHVLASSRPWVAERARGYTLEVGVGTGLNLPHYGLDITITGIDWSPAMLALARQRIDGSPSAVELQVADAMALPFTDASFDTVVSTFTLCSVPDVRIALTEMARVLRPGGRLLLADHVASTSPIVRQLQSLMERVTIPSMNEHFCRRPSTLLEDLGFVIEERERERLGVIERVSSRHV